MGKELRIGMIGYGFMGRAHSNAYCKVGNFFDLEVEPVLKAVCARSEDKAKAFADQWGYESVETDWRKLIARDDIDAVDICVPNNLHKEISIAAAEAGKAILCEKPIAMDTAEGEEMCLAVEKAGVANMVWYNYRRVPAVTLAKQLIDDGRLGRVFHYRANFLQDWTISEELPQGGTALWRLDAAAAGSGVTGDLLAHCIDTAIWLNGSITDVSAMTETFIKERVHQETGAKQPVEIDDACAFLCHFQNGSLGLFESTRYARGHKALYTLEVNGEKASLRWDLHDLHRWNTSSTVTMAFFVAGGAFTYPMAIIRTWITGGFQACRSAMSIALCIRSLTSWKVTQKANLWGQPSVTRWKRKRSATLY